MLSLMLKLSGSIHTPAKATRLIAGRLFALLSLVLLVVVPHTATASLLPAVNVNDTRWLQPLDFVNTSWNEVAAVCSFADGTCNGSLNGHDLTGWVWADTDDIRGLLDFYEFPSRRAYGRFFSSRYGTPFEPTSSSGGFDEASVSLSAFHRDRNEDGKIGSSYIDWRYSYEYDLSYVSINYGSSDLDYASPNRGVYFFEAPDVAVSTPGTVFMILSGLLILVLRFKPQASQTNS